MRDFDDICREYEITEEDLEKGLLRTLKTISDGKVPVVVNQQLFYDKIDFLHLNGYIYREHPLNKLTQKGERAIKRGRVYFDTKEHKKLKHKVLWDRITPHVLQGISILVAIILGILGFFLPRECPSKSASDIKEIIPHIEEHIIETEAQINEISQATDSTKKETCDNDK